MAYWCIITATTKWEHVLFFLIEKKFLDSSTLVYICLHPSSDSRMLVCICLHSFVIRLHSSKVTCVHFFTLVVYTCLHSTMTGLHSSMALLYLSTLVCTRLVTRLCFWNRSIFDTYSVYGSFCLTSYTTWSKFFLNLFNRGKACKKTKKK